MIQLILINSVPELSFLFCIVAELLNSHKYLLGFLLIKEGNNTNHIQFENNISLSIITKRNTYKTEFTQMGNRAVCACVDVTTVLPHDLVIEENLFLCRVKTQQNQPVILNSVCVHNAHSAVDSSWLVAL